MDYLEQAKLRHPDTAMACALIAIADELRKLNDQQGTTTFNISSFEDGVISKSQARLNLGYGDDA
jgi:hypothetical protein